VGRSRHCGLIAKIIMITEEHKRKIGEANKISVKRYYANGGVPWNKKSPVFVKCETCGVEFQIKPARITRARFCSLSCHAKKKFTNRGHGLSRTKEYRKIYQQKRRFLEYGSDGSYSFKEWEILKVTTNYRCVNCGEQEPDIKLTVDHIIPLSKQGINIIKNIQPLCRKCNLIKGGKIIDFMKLSETVTAD